MIKNILYKGIKKISFYYDKYVNIPRYFPNISKQINRLNVENIKTTANELLHSNKSLSRFGDGEIKWLLKIKNNESFEKNSSLLSKRLLEILYSNDKNFLIGLPDFFTLNSKFTSDSIFYWKRFMTKYGNEFLFYLNYNKKYYNTSVSRPYIDYNNNKIANYTFGLWKQLWDGKDILIIEGNESRLGIGNDLFNNASSIKRIECPSTNAFESYKTILNTSIDFLNNTNKKYLTLISLGPTATVLSYDLFSKGYRSIDIGHIDIEYEWYLIGAKEKIDLPYKYVNENINGKYALPIFNNKYNREIIKIIK